MSPLATAERVVKCPTSHCPGWITVDDERPQTVPCRYCRLTINTLTYLLKGTPDAPAPDAATPALPPAVHEAFNSLLLAVAGQTGGNIYLRPAERTIVDLVPSTRGVIVEYNTALARHTGPAAVVALIFHRLLHIQMHPAQDKPLGLQLRPGARDKEPLQNAINYLLILADHPWIVAQIDAVAPDLRASEQTWGLHLAGMLTGSETFFPAYMADRDRRWIVEQFADPAVPATAITAAVLERLAALSARFFAGQREDLRRTLTALALAEVGLRDPAQQAAYAAALEARDLPGVAAAAAVATHLVADLTAARVTYPTFDAAAHRHALETGLKALGLHTAFEVQTLKSGQ